MLGFHPKNFHCLLLKASTFALVFLFQTNSALLHKYYAQFSLVAGKPEVMAGWPPIKGYYPTLMACRPGTVAGRPLMMHHFLLEQRANRAKRGYSHRLFALCIPPYHQNKLKGVIHLVQEPSIKQFHCMMAKEPRCTS